MTLSKEKAAGGNRAALQKLHIKPNQNCERLQAKSETVVDRSRLMPPVSVLRLLRLRHSAKGDWLQVQCPFHAAGQERNPSLSMHASDGHYRCFTCGAKGHDVIAFYRAVTGASFVETLQALGVQHG